MTPWQGESYGSEKLTVGPRTTTEGLHKPLSASSCSAGVCYVDTAPACPVLFIAFSLGGNCKASRTQTSNFST